MSAYDNVIGGKLKLKGKALDVKAGGVKKKKKKKKKQKNHEEQALKITERELMEGENTETLGKLIEGEEDEEDAVRSEKESEDANVQPDDDLLTPAERRYIEQKQRLDVQKLAKEANKSHRNRIEDFNQYLANMSEHYDIPKVGPG